MHRNNGTQDDSVRLSLGAALTRHLSPSLILCNIRKRRSDAGLPSAHLETLVLVITVLSFVRMLKQTERI